MRTRLSPDDRKEAILYAATLLSHQHAYNVITRLQVATQAGCSEALVSVYFGSMEQLRRAVVREAIAKCDLAIVAQAITLKHPLATKVPADLREMALAAVS